MPKLSTVRPQRANANKHTARGMGALEDSIQKDGWIGAITVAADGEAFDGSARVEVGVTKGFEDAIVVRSKGDKPVVHIREDIPTADDPRAIRLGIAANRVAELNLEWETEILADLRDDGVLDGLFRDNEIDALLNNVIDPSELWQGMPEFEHSDLTADAAFVIRVFLKDADDLAALGNLLGKDLTGRKYVWFGKQPHGAIHEAV